MLEKLLLVEPQQNLRRSIVDSAQRVAYFLNKKIQIYSVQTLARAEDLIDSGEISFLMTNANLGEDGYEGISLVDYAILPSPRTIRERVCIYSRTIPVDDVLPGVIQVSINNINQNFLQAFIWGLTTNPN